MLFDINLLTVIISKHFPFMDLKYKYVQYLVILCNVYQNDADNFRVPVLRQRGRHIFELDGVKCHTFNWKMFDLFTH